MYVTGKVKMLPHDKPRQNGLANMSRKIWENINFNIISMLSGLPSKFYHFFAILVLYEQFEYIPGERKLLDFVVRILVGVVNCLSFGIEPITRNFLLAGESSGSRQEFGPPAITWALHGFIFWFC
jgi:hypothetical protein